MQKKAREESDQQYVLFPVWSSGSINPQNNDGDAAFDGKEPDFDAKKPESEVIVSSSNSAQSKKQDDTTKREAKGKSHVESFIGYKDLSAEFEDYSDNSINEVNAIDTLVPTVGQSSPNSTNTFSAAGNTFSAAGNTFSAAGPSNTAASPTHGKYSCIDASQLPDDPDMPELEDITYSDDEDNMFNDDFHTCMFACFLLQEEPKRIHQALKDPSWIKAMQEELLQFKMQKVWILVDLPYGKRAISTKWVFKNKKDESGIVVRNKARLVTQRHTQEEGIDYGEVFAPVERIEAIRLFLAYASFMGFMVYQMDVKS
nr:putative ribonuclease H-like domain-containing protein [Tanacetum cinerariifolium]